MDNAPETKAEWLARILAKAPPLTPDRRRRIVAMLARSIPARTT